MNSSKRIRADVRDAILGHATPWRCDVCGKHRQGTYQICGTCFQAERLAELFAENTLKTRRFPVSRLLEYGPDEQERVLEFLRGLPCTERAGLEFEFVDRENNTAGIIEQVIVMRKRGGVPMVKSANKC